MSKKVFIITAEILVGIALILLIVYLMHHNVEVFNPGGLVALQEKNLFYWVAGIGLAVVIPTILLTFFVAWKYRDGNTKAKYDPNWTKSTWVEVIRWGILVTVISIMAIITWQASHSIDPWKPLQSNAKPITIQVVALQWRWLFIYPDQKIATINYIDIPVNTPVNFELTADAPMNSFWIPQLGGQMYAMAGMVTRRPLMATTIGEFAGSDAEISGTGFAKMKFTVKSTSQADFDSWVKASLQSTKPLSYQEYQKIAKPTMDESVAYYTLSDPNLYNTIVMQFMVPSPTPSQSPNKIMAMPGM